MKKFSRFLLALSTSLLLCTPASAAIDELAFGDSPAVMVYLFSLQEVGQMPDSPYTLTRVKNAVAFCKGKLSDDLVNRLQSIATLVKDKKYAQAKKAVKDLQNQIYGE